MLKLDQLRAETSACARKNHLNNAGAALVPDIVNHAIVNYLTLEAQLGGYEAADQQATEIAGFQDALAKLLNTRAENIAWATSATDAYARALSAIPWKAGDCILTTENDYASNQIAFLSLQKRFGVKLLRARDSRQGGVDLADFERLARQHVPKLVAVTHVPTNSGLVQPVEAIGQICKGLDSWCLVDACQSAGQLQLDLQKISCDFLSATMRKYMRGPRGMGFLFVSDRVLEAGLELLLPDMHGSTWTAPDTYTTASGARRFEYWEMSPALILGSRTAVEYALNIGMDQIEGRVRKLAELTRNLLTTETGARVLDMGIDRCGIVTAYHPNWDQRAILEYLWKRNINVRTAPGNVAQIDFPRKGVEWALRVSPHYYNTEEEIKEAVAAIRAYTEA